MLRKISISNFQSHADSTLEFSEGVNAIIGPSDSGKTAIIRALRWLVWNRPLGDEIRSNWGGDTRVECFFGTIGIVRNRTKALNRYILWEELGEIELIFDAIRQDVPEEIQRALNMNEINLQMQLDAPFLLSNSPGEVGAHFNRIAHLDMIDTGTRNVQSWIRSIEQDIRSGEQYLRQQQVELEKYEHLDEFDQQLQMLEALDKQKTTTAQQKISLSSLKEDIAKTETDIGKHAAILQIEEQVMCVLNLIEQRRQLHANKEVLWITLFDINKTETSINNLSKITECEGRTDELLKLNAKREKLQEEVDALHFLITDIEKTGDKYDHERKLSIELQIQFDEIMPNICPLCGQEVKK